MLGFAMECQKRLLKVVTTSDGVLNWFYITKIYIFKSSVLLVRCRKWGCDIYSMKCIRKDIIHQITEYEYGIR